MIQAPAYPADIAVQEVPTATTLNMLLPNDEATIERVNGTSFIIRRRLLEMGMTRGTRIRVIRFAPMGDPIEIQIRGYRLSLRKEEAESIIVTR